MAKKKKQPVSDVDMLDELLSDAGAKPKAATSAKADTIIDCSCDPVLLERLEDFAASSLIASIACEREKADNQNLKETALEAFVELWVANGARPDNPLLSSPHASARLQVKNYFKLAVECETPNMQAVNDLLDGADLKAELIEGLRSCITVDQNLKTKPLDKLKQDGTAAEKQAVNEFLELAKKLSAASRALLFEKKPEFNVDSQKLAQVISTHCKTKETLQTVMSLFMPQLALSQAKHDNALGVAKQRFEAALENEK